MAVNNLTTMNGLFKQVYGPRVEYAYPAGTRLIKEIPFDPQKSIGAAYNFPVVLAHENGFTLGAPSQSTSYSLLNPVAAQSRNATVDGYEVILNSEITYEATAKAAAAGAKAFVRATKHVVKNMTDSHRKMLEIQALYGQQDLGVVESVSTNTATITAATWSPGIWAGLEGARLDVLTSDLGTERVGGGEPVTAIDLSARTVTFATIPTSTAAGDRIFFENAVTAGGTPAFAENLGIHKALDTSGTVYGISTSDFNLWKSSEVAVGGGQLIFDKVQEASARVAEKGGIDGRNTLYVSNLTWVDLLGDQAALRRYDEEGTTSKYNTGAEAICFYTATGKVDIVPSIYIKRGFAYLLNLDAWCRTGAMDFKFGDPVSSDAFHRLEGKAGVNVRSYSNVSIISEALGRNCLLTGIVNSAN